MSKNVDQRGRRAEARHIRLYHTVTGSAAWLDLSGEAVKLLVALMRLDKGGDNGTLFLSTRTAARAIGVHRNTAARLFRELEEHGFIAMTAEGRFRPGGCPAPCWRLTWLGAPGHPPTRDFERWAPMETKSRAQKSSQSGTNFMPVLETEAGAGTNIVPPVTEMSHVSIDAGGPSIVPQVVCHGHSAAMARKRGGNSLIIAGGVSTDTVDPSSLDQLRTRVIAYLQSAGVGAQGRLATMAAIPGGTLSKFIAGKGLNRTHFINLQLALPKTPAREAA